MIIENMIDFVEQEIFLSFKEKSKIENLKCVGNEKIQNIHDQKQCDVIVIKCVLDEKCS